MMKQKSWRLGGGMDLTTAQTLRSKYPGSLLAGINYESVKEGYRRCDGFERYDGRIGPSEVVFEDQARVRSEIGPVPGKGEVLGVWRFRGRAYAFKEATGSNEIRMYGSSSSGWERIQIDKLLGFVNGRGLVPGRFQTVKGRTSGATAQVMETALVDGTFRAGTAEGMLVVRNTSGTFQADEVLVIGQEAGDGAVSTGAVAVAVSDNVAGYRYAEEAHKQIGNIHVSGTYPNLGDVDELAVVDQQLSLKVLTPDDAKFFEDKEIAITFRNNRKSIFRFTEATVVIEDATTRYRWPLIGPLYLNPPVAGERLTFRIRQKGYRPQHTEMTGVGDAVSQRVVAGPDSVFHFWNANFFGSADQERMYGVTGSGPAFEFDGRTFISIFGPVEDDRPILVCEHEQHLFLAYRNGSVIHSGTGKPRVFEAIEGASELTVGDTPTGLLPGYRGTLLMFGRNRTKFLKGTSALNWELKTLSNEAGAIKNTVVEMESPVVFDDRGLREIEAVQEFGDLSIGTSSEIIRPFLDRLRKGKVKPVAATRVRNKSQYRLWFDDGQCLVVRHDRDSRGMKKREFTTSAYYFNDEDGNEQQGIVTNVCSVEDPDGRERIFATFEGSPYVYELDKGYSFDGKPIPAFMQLPFNDLGTPFQEKKFPYLLIEVGAVDLSKFRVWVDFDDDLGGRFEVEDPFLALSELGWWGESHWDEFYWLDDPLRIAEARIDGRGRNLSVAFASVPDQVTPPHVISAITVYYKPMRLRRGR